MHYRMRYLLDFDLKIRSGQVWARKTHGPQDYFLLLLCKSLVWFAEQRSVVLGADYYLEWLRDKVRNNLFFYIKYELYVQKPTLTWH